ncbi:hypothetical protein [Methanobrevibacter sp.]|uniref:hypothetical protein n=1 Tax=Methanobrevibacter sp. TaxID=66852 RepID=UPI0038631B7E
MDNLTNKEFIEFIKSHEKFFKSITEISMNDYDEPLIENDFKMYSLDEMCWDCKLLEKAPTTTDALYYKEHNDGKLSLYLIEFKFHNFNSPNAKDMLELISKDVNADGNKYNCLSNTYKKYLRKINNYYGDEVLFKLVLKPIESLNIVIPALYEQYCLDNDYPIKDIRKFLENVEKKLIIFVSHYDDNPHRNKSKQRLQSMDIGLKNNYDRLEQGKLIDSYEIYARYQFNYFLLTERIS